MFGGYLIGLATWVLKYTFHKAKKHSFFDHFSYFFAAKILLDTTYYNHSISYSALCFFLRLGPRPRRPSPFYGPALMCPQNYIGKHKDYYVDCNLLSGSFVNQPHFCKLKVHRKNTPYKKRPKATKKITLL